MFHSEIRSEHYITKEGGQVRFAMDKNGRGESKFIQRPWLRHPTVHTTVSASVHTAGSRVLH